MLKKIVAVVLAVVLMSTVAISASAENAEIQPYFNYTASTITSIDISSGGNASCTAVANGYSDSATKVKITMTLQKKSLLWWSEVTTWTQTFDDYIGSMTMHRTVTEGKYRVKAVYVVYSGSNSEEITSYSQEDSYNP